MEEVFTYDTRRAKKYNTQQLMDELKEELIGKEQKAMARNGILFLATQNCYNFFWKAALNNSKSRKKVMQSRKIYQGAYYEFKALQKQTQGRIQAKLDEKAQMGSPRLKIN